MLEFLDSGKRVVKLPKKVELTSLSCRGNLFELKCVPRHQDVEEKRKNVTIQNIHTYENETQCVLQSVKAYPKDGRFYVFDVQDSRNVQNRIFGGREGENRTRSARSGKRKIIKLRKAQGKKLKEIEEKKMEEKKRKKKKEEEKKKNVADNLEIVNKNPSR